jgi:hypothetical protein
MPAQPSWYTRIPEILGQLDAEGLPPFLDRPAIERLFRVGRRQAIRLMGVLNGYQVGKTFLVDGQSLKRFLAEIERTGAGAQARARKERVLSALNEVANRAAAQRVRIPAAPTALERRVSDLPAALELIEPGRLLIHYRGAEDLLSRIVELAASATNDFPAFRKRYEGRG